MGNPQDSLNPIQIPNTSLRRCFLDAKELLSERSNESREKHAAENTMWSKSSTIMSRKLDKARETKKRMSILLPPLGSRKEVGHIVWYTKPLVVTAISSNCVPHKMYIEEFGIGDNTRLTSGKHDRIDTADSSH